MILRQVQPPGLVRSRTLEARFDWLRRLLAWQADVTRHLFGALADDEYRGLYIPDAEADLLATPEPQLPAGLRAARLALVEERAALQDDDTDALSRLARRFDLSPFEQDALLLALAPEYDLRLERLIAFIQDDVTKKR